MLPPVPQQPPGIPSPGQNQGCAVQARECPQPHSLPTQLLAGTQQVPSLLARLTRLTYDFSAHDGQRRQIRGAEGREPARVHLGHPGAPKQLILEEQADLQEGGTAAIRPT